MNDWQLLKKYAAENSEDAFRALVERYSGMVYHAALRQTGNPHTAEEVAQVVFIALAQKADRIPRQATLYGWLFRATRFAVLNQVRTNINRERREQESLTMQPAIEPNEPDSTWERITPQLNDALDSLSAADRELVMVRFFGNKSHKDVAEALGVSEETARKRISRAIERLREIFARRGVVVSSLALAAAFTAHGAEAAPVEVASSWAEVAMAKAAATTAAGSAGGILGFVTYAKLAGFVAALVVGGAAFAIIKSTSRGSQVAAPLAANLTPPRATPATNVPSSAPTAPPKPAADATAPAAALDKVQAALHDPNPTSVYPNSVMREAIAGLDDKKKAALPILEAALHETNALVRLRAVDGLGLIGPEAGEAAPLLLALLRDGGLQQAIPQTTYSVQMLKSEASVMAMPIYTDNILLYVLGQIHPSPKTLPEFARLIQESKFVRGTVNHTLGQFPSQHQTMPGGWLWAVANEDSRALNNAFRPLLQDPDEGTRFLAAYSLVFTLGDQADAGVFPVAAELIKSDDDVFRRNQGMTLLVDAARDLSPTGENKKPVLYASRLGPYLNETVSALADAAYHSKEKNLRLAASKLLDVLVPDLRKSNPVLAAELEQESQAEAFAARATSGEAAIPEILEGLKKFPKAAPEIAADFARNNGSNAVELLPVFAEALSALAPAPDAATGDRTRAINQRGTLADAMQQLAPEQPKPLFTARDTVAIRRIMFDQAAQAGPDRAQKISDARKSSGWLDTGSGGLFDVPPDGVRRLLAAMKDADAPTYDALVAKVKEIDPHFSDTAAPR